MTPEPMKDAARDAVANAPLRVLARGGYAANGAVHVLIGTIILTIAFGGTGESDQSGAFRAVGAAPLGFLALWVLAGLLWALAVWHVLEGILISRGSDVKKWGVRISEWGQAVVFGALGTVAASVALGARPDAEQTAEDASRGVLAVPGGALLLGAAGLGIGIGGVVFVVMGTRRSFRSKVAIPPGRLGVTITVLGVIGFIAKGVSLAIIGTLVVVAAIRVDPEAAGGLDGAIDALLGVAGGPVLVGAVGAGFVSYGVFCFFRARFAKL
ncbi:DUF1206 domain-containing protein [Microbacterium sp.]|uniref:DUF1206 domain-containing protein n=1 Tax=Microbacterium sp. TaxID=51671 RepID=UPI003C74AB8A